MRRLWQKAAADNDNGVRSCAVRAASARTAQDLTPLIVAVALCFASGCRDDTAPRVIFPPIDNVVVYTWPTYVQVGDTLRVAAGGFNASGWEITQPIRTVEWRTDSPDRVRIEPAMPVVPIQPSIYARGLAPGVAHISATLNGVTGSDSVIVLPAIRAVEVTPQSATIRVGDSLHVTAQIVAANGSTLASPYIVWESSSVTVANFGPGNTVIGLLPGVTRITATVAHAQGVLALTVVR